MRFESCRVARPVLLATALLLAACSTGDAGSQSTAPCDLALAGTVLVDTPYSERSYEIALGAFERWQADGPAELADDLEIVTRSWRETRPLLEAVDWRGADVDMSQIDEGLVADLENAGERIDAYLEDTCGYSADGEPPADAFDSPGAARQVATYLGTDEAGARCFIDVVGTEALTASGGELAAPQVSAYDECGLDLTMLPIVVDRFMAESGVTEAESTCLLAEFERLGSFDGDLSDAAAEAVLEACDVSPSTEGGG